MVSCYPLILIYLASPFFVSGSDYNCADTPVFTPSMLVVKHGDPANAVCEPCHKNCREGGLENAKGKVVRNGTTLLWTVDSLTEWDIFIMCYYITDDGEQCSSNLEITVYQPPQSVSISFVNHTGQMFEREQYRLQCSVQNVAPVQNLTVTFYRGAKVLHQLQSKSGEKKAVNEIFTLDFNATRDDDGAQYWCEAKLELGPDGPQPPPVVTSEYLTTTAYYVPEITGSPVLITVTEGDPLLLNCSSVGNPDPTYTWTRPSDHSSSHSHSVFTISAVGSEDRGQYICTVSNAAGNVTKEFIVDIKANPLPWIIIGVVGAVVLFIVVCVLCFRQYKQSRKGSYNLKDVFRFTAKRTAVPLVQQN